MHNRQILFHSVISLFWILIAFILCCPSTLHLVPTFCSYILYFTFCILYHCVITIRTLDQIKSKISLSFSLSVSSRTSFRTRKKVQEWRILQVCDLFLVFSFIFSPSFADKGTRNERKEGISSHRHIGTVLTVNL